MHGSKALALVRPLLTLRERLRLGSDPIGHEIETPLPDATSSALPIQHVLGLWADSAAVTRDSTLPLRAAGLLQLEDLGLAGFCLLAAPNGHHAFESMIRYSPLLVTGGRWLSRVNRDESVQAVWSRPGELWLGHRLGNETGLAQFVACLRRVLGADFSPSRVTFRHAAPENSAEHRAYFRCPVSFEEAEDSFTFSSRALDRTPPLANAALGEYLLRQAQALLPPSGGPSVTSALREILERELLREEPDLRAARAARALGNSERALRRRLQEEGTNFRNVLAEVRRDVARQRLQRGREPITQIALDMGFSDSSAFSHAMRRWFGQSASELRRAPRPASTRSRGTKR